MLLANILNRSEVAFKRFLLNVFLGSILGFPATTVVAEPSLWVFGIGTSDQFYSQKALNTAYEKFFGRPRQQSDGGMTFGGGNLSFGEGDDVKVKIRTSREVFAGKSWEVWRQKRLSVRRTVRFAVGERRYFLPNGFDVLIDPVDVSFTYGHVSADYSLHKDVKIGRSITVFGSLGAGLVAYHARTHISSALIDTRSSTSGVEPFIPASIGLRRDMKSGQAFVKAAINGYPQGIYDLKISVGYEF